MLKQYFSGVCALALLLGVSPALAQSFSGEIPEFNPNPVQQSFSCKVVGTNRLESNNENVITARVEYDSSWSSQDVAFQFDAYGDLGRIVSLNGTADINRGEEYLGFAAGGGTSIQIPFNTVQNEDVVIQASIGNTACESKTFTPVQAVNFGFSNLIDFSRFSPQPQSQFQPELDIQVDTEIDLDALENADQNNNQEDNNEQSPEQNNVRDNIIGANQQPDLTAGVDISRDNEINLDARNNQQEQNEAVENQENNEPAEEALVQASCKLVSEARKNNTTFRIFAAVSYEGFPEGDHPFLVVAGMPDGSNLQKSAGTVRVDAQGNGIILDEESSFQFAFDRSAEEQQIVVNGQIAGVVCASALFLDAGVEEDVAVQNGNGEVNNRNVAANLAGEQMEDEMDQTDERVLPEGADSDDVLLLESLELTEDTVNANRNSSEDDDATDWKSIALVVLGLIVIVLLGANLMKKNPAAPME